MEGGTGLDKPIEWVAVRADQARILKTYLQSDLDPDSKPVFDMVTLEQRQAIDRAEEAARLGGMGNQPSVSRRAPKGRLTDLRQGEDVMDEARAAAELRQRERILEGNEQEGDDAGAEAFIQDPAVVGLMQALSGLNRGRGVKTASEDNSDGEEEQVERVPIRKGATKAAAKVKAKAKAKAQAEADDRLPPLDEGVDIAEAIGATPGDDPDEGGRIGGRAED
jgi:hypothetical protein